MKLCGGIKGILFLKKCFPRKHDTIFCYTKNTDTSINFEGILIPYSALTEKRYNHVDEDGRRYKISALRNGKQEIVYMKAGKYPDDVWDDLHVVRGKESIGYPTQKPEALLERIIKASSNPGDIVLDAFCRGGTTPAVARRLGRKFIGIDQSVRAIAVSNARLEKQTDLLTNDVYEVKTKAYDYDKLRNMDPLKFESLMIELFGGVPNIKQRSDGGKDGIKRVDGVALPIQVKQQSNVGRPQIQNFVGHLVQNKQHRGFFIAFDFAKTAYECVAEIKQNVGVEVELVKIEKIVPLVKKAKITLDWNYETVYEKQYVTLIASGEEIELWQWDFDYNESKGFSAAVMKDTEGNQTIELTAGKHIIAVRGTDKTGIESIATITLYSNGSVHE